MRVLQINVTYNKGSTGKIVHDIHHQLLADGHDSFVCYGRGEKVDEPYVFQAAPDWYCKTQSLRSRITGYAYAGAEYSTQRIIRMIVSKGPDIVHLHCINGYFVNIYQLLDFLKKNKIKTVLTLHAEFMYTAGCSHALECTKWLTGCGHCPQLKANRPHSWLLDRSAQEWRLMKTAYEGFEDLTVVCVSEWLSKRAKQSPFFANLEIITIANGINTKDLFRPTDNSNIRKRHGITDKKVLLHVTPSFSHPLKGGQYILELAKRLSKKNVTIVIVGFDGTRDLLPPNAIGCAHTNNQIELAAYYSMADLTVITSERETYSMICAESLACGTPVVGFRAGAPEEIALSEYSEFVAYGDIDALESCVVRWMEIRFNREDISASAGIAYSRDTMYQQYMNVYGMLLCK